MSGDQEALGLGDGRLLTFSSELIDHPAPSGPFYLTEEHAISTTTSGPDAAEPELVVSAPLTQVSTKTPE